MEGGNCGARGAEGYRGRGLPRAKAPAAFLVAIVSTGSCRLQSSSICYVPVAPAAGRRSYSRALRRVHAVLRSLSR